MTLLKEDSAEVEEDLYHGQIVIITFRWILILGALVLSLWNPSGIDNPGTVTLQVGLLLAYAVVNFFLHAQYLRGEPSLPTVVYAISLADLALITFVIAFLQGGLSSGAYVFYLPALLALSVAFPRYVAAPMAGGVIAVYALIAFASSGPDEVQTVIIRLLMMGAVAFCGGLYRHIEHNRRTGNARMVVLVGGASRKGPAATARARRSAGYAPRAGRAAPATTTDKTDATVTDGIGAR